MAFGVRAVNGMRRLFLGIGFAGAALGLVVCGGAGGGRPTLAADAPIPLRLAFGAPVVQSLPLWAAYEGGFLKRNGFEPTTPVRLSGPEATAALVGGHVDLIATGGFSTALAAGSGASIRMIAAATRYAPFVIYTRDALGSPAQLKGLKVGTTGPGSEPFIEFHLYLKRVGVDPGDVAFIKVGLEAETFAAMVNGAVQVGLFHWPVAEQAQAAGFHLLADLSAQHIPWILTGFVVPQTMLDEHPERVRRIAEALLAATACALARPAFAEPVLAKYTRVSDPASLKRGIDEFRAVVPADLTPSPEAVRNIVAQAAALHPGLNPSATAKFYAPQVLTELRANGFVRQAAQCKTGP